MKLDDLRSAIEGHTGTFLCTKIHDIAVTKEVEFHHEFAPPVALDEKLPIDQLTSFYETFGNLLLYHDPRSGDVAYYVARPSEWGYLEECFEPWLDCLEEGDDFPDWLSDRLVIGEIPMSGNYLLVPRTGEKRGHVYEFEHDGFEFIELAPGLEQFVRRMLRPSESDLTKMASHMRFVEGDDRSVQWWISEMRDNQGNVIVTRE